MPVDALRCRRVREPDSAAATDLVLPENPENGELQLRLVTAADAAAPIELLEHRVRPCLDPGHRRHFIASFVMSPEVMEVSACSV